MKQHDYARDSLLFYPGKNLSEEERQRVENYEIAIDELTVDHIVYSMARQLETNFQIFYTVAEQVVGEEQALEIAREIGRQYGGVGYANLLKALGREGDGGPETMYLYQDLVHAIRGPKHIAALFGEYDDERCTVRRKQCIYFSEEFPENGKYTGAFEQGCFDGYMNADPNLIRVENPACRWKGDDHCEHSWVYKASNSDND